MASSLDKLSSIQKIDQFVNLKKQYSGNQLSLLLRKVVYPYNYVDCLNKLDETSLPPKEAFLSKLTGEGITDDDYQHAHTVWKEFNIESMKITTKYTICLMYYYQLIFLKTLGVFA